MNNFDAVIIGGGATGTSVFRDLSMRGLKVCLIEKREISAGTTSHSHQNLVSGFRYILKDPLVAEECAKENEIIAQIAPHVIEPIRNYFLGFSGSYTEKALGVAKDLGIWFKQVKPEVAFREIHSLNRKIDIVIETNDRDIDAAMFCKLNCNSAIKRDGILFERTPIERIERRSKEFIVEAGDGLKISAKCIVNAAGAWANNVVSKLGVELMLLYNQGTIIVQKSLSPRGLQYFHEPGDGDAYIVHDGLAWLGTTSTTIKSPDEASPEPGVEDYLKEKFSVIIPEVVNQETIYKFVGVRPLLREKNTFNGREQTRSFQIIENPEGFYSIIGGKLTTARLMAEKVSDMICEEMGMNIKCTTAKLPLGD